MPLDWRIQAAATTATDVSAAYPGGPAHPAGSRVILTSIVQTTDNERVGFYAPSAVALALSIAGRASKQAKDLKETVSYSSVPSPDGPVKLVQGESTGSLFDYFEQCFVSAVFSYQALEAYCNYKIAYTMQGTFRHERRGTLVELSMAQVEREVSTEEKLSTVLPSLLNRPTPRGQVEWEQYVRLKRLRDSTMHLKSHHQWTSSDQFDDSPYALFLQQTPLSIPELATSMIRYFAVEHEHEWLRGVDRILKG